MSLKKNKNHFFRKLGTYWRAFAYSMPIRLVVMQLRQHPVMVAIWGIVYSVLGGGLLGSLGAKYVLLEPEYLGKVDFLSFLWEGAAFGAFVFAYHLSLYIHVGYRFPFLVLRRAPFFTFVINNSILPIFFLILYATEFLAFQSSNYGFFSLQVGERLVGFLMGALVIFAILSSTFFATSKNLFQYFGENIQQEFERQKSLRRLRFLINKAKESEQHPYRVLNYLGIRPFGFRSVDSTEHLDRVQIMKVLNQNHGNLLLLQFVFFLIILTIGFLGEYSAFQIPVGASGFLGFALAVMISGALTFWVRKMGMITFLIFFGLVYGYYNFDFMKEKNCAFGMNYQSPPAVYSEEAIRGLLSPEVLKEDSLSSIQMLERWKRNYQNKYGKAHKPKALFVCTTGGGVRASVWAFTVLQHIDKLSDGRSTDEIRLMSGASGGMVGLAYFRELMLAKQKGLISHISDSIYQKEIGKDMLNRIFFQAMTDAFLPNLPFYIGKKYYQKEKGFSFDKQLMKNMPEFEGKTLGDYREPEASAKIPPMILTPTIANHGRQLYISPMGVSFLAKPKLIADRYYSKVPGVEFRAFFKQNDPDSVWFASCLRMNATFPFVLPLVALPSQPEIKVVDAGAMDNFGIITAVKYLYQFHDWFAENTEEIIFVTIRDSEKEDEVQDYDEANILSKIMSPLGGAVTGFKVMGDFANDYLLENVQHWYRGNIRVVSYEYPLHSLPNPASMSFHLTELEKKTIPIALSYPHNEVQTEVLRNIFKKK